MDPLFQPYHNLILTFNYLKQNNYTDKMDRGKIRVGSLTIGNGMTLEDIASQIQYKSMDIICVKEGREILIIKDLADLPRNLTYVAPGATEEIHHFRSKQTEMLYTVFTREVAEILVYHCIDTDHRETVAQFLFPRGSGVTGGVPEVSRVKNVNRAEIVSTVFN